MDKVLSDWVIPLVSAITAAEWFTLWYLRRTDETMPAEKARDRIATVDMVVLLICIGLLLSSLTYPSITNTEGARFFVNVTRVILFLVGADLLFTEYRLRRGNRVG